MFAHSSNTTYLSHVAQTQPNVCTQLKHNISFARSSNTTQRLLSAQLYHLHAAQTKLNVCTQLKHNISFASSSNTTQRLLAAQLHHLHAAQTQLIVNTQFKNLSLRRVMFMIQRTLHNVIHLYSTVCFFHLKLFFQSINN
jgi:hypothetical protein